MPALHVVFAAGNPMYGSRDNHSSYSMAGHHIPIVGGMVACGVSGDVPPEPCMPTAAQLLQTWRSGGTLVVGLKAPVGGQQHTVLRLLRGAPLAP